MQQNINIKIGEITLSVTFSGIEKTIEDIQINGQSCTFFLEELNIHKDIFEYIRSRIEYMQSQTNSTDIDKCHGYRCSLKNICWRYLCPAETLQYYLLESPYDDETSTCNFIIDVNQDKLNK